MTCDLHKEKVLIRGGGVGTEAAASVVFAGS
jgi:hypothetical protein